MTEAGGRDRRKLVWRVVQVMVSVAIVGGIFLYAIPKIADYDAVAEALGAMTWLELATLVGAMLFNLYTYWLQNMASIPGLGLWQAAVNNQTTTSIANTIPGGSVLAVGVGYEMYRSWGFTASAIALSVVVTGIWNMFMKLGLPVAALAILAIEGRAGGGLLVAALIGVAILMAAVVLFALMLWKKALPRRIGDALGRGAAFLLRLVRKPSVGDWGERAVRFRRQTIDLVAGRGAPHAHDRGEPSRPVRGPAPLAPSRGDLGAGDRHGPDPGRVRLRPADHRASHHAGGVGFVELGYIGGLILAGRNHADVPLDVFRAQVVAAVLVSGPSRTACRSRWGPSRI